MEIPEAAVRKTSDGVLVSFRVQPGAKKSEIVGAYGETALKLALKAPPVDNRANEELVRLLAELCGVSRAQISIRSGSTSRSKTILFSGADQDMIKNALWKK